jgi:hypothetical protein
MTAIAQLMLASASLPPGVWQWATYYITGSLNYAISKVDVSDNGMKMIAVSSSGQAHYYGSAVFISLDGGANWLNKTAFVPLYQYTRPVGCAVAGDGSRFVIIFEDEYHGWYGYAYSTDNGANWTRVNGSAIGGILEDVDMSRNGLIVAMAMHRDDGDAGNRGIIYSTDGGVTRVTRQSSHNWNFVRLAADGVVGFAGEEPSEGTNAQAGKISKTTNGFVGIDSSIQNNISSGNYTEYLGVSDDGQKVIASVYDDDDAGGFVPIAYVRYSENGGQTFVTKTTPVSDLFRVGISGDGKVLCLAGENSSQVRTSNNDGVLWTLQPGIIGTNARMRLSSDGRKIIMRKGYSTYATENWKHYVATATN